MSAIIELESGIKARIENQQWSANNHFIALVLALTLPIGGPPTYDPDPDLTAAQAAVDRFGGKIVWSSPPDPEPDGVE